MTTLPTRVRVARDVLWRTVDGEVLVVDLRSERYIGLEGVGAHTWRLLVGGTNNAPRPVEIPLDESMDLPAVVSAVVRSYDVAPERARRDVEHLVASLIGIGLLEPLAGTTTHPEGTLEEAGS